jgi:hypothetical protein
MNAIRTMLLVVPILVSGYALLSIAALAGATVLAWDGAHLFFGGEPSQQVLRQRRHVTSVARAVTSLVSVLLVLVVIGVALATAVGVVVSLR